MPSVIGSSVRIPPKNNLLGGITAFRERAAHAQALSVHAVPLTLIATVLMGPGGLVVAGPYQLGSYLLARRRLWHDAELRSAIAAANVDDLLPPLKTMIEEQDVISCRYFLKMLRLGDPSKYETVLERLENPEHLLQTEAELKAWCEELHKIELALRHYRFMAVSAFGWLVSKSSAEEKDWITIMVLSLVLVRIVSQERKLRREKRALMVRLGLKTLTLSPRALSAFLAQSPRRELWNPFSLPTKATWIRRSLRLIDPYRANQITF